MEPAVDILAANFRHVLVVASFYNHTRVRMRADLLKEKRVWFQGTARQIELWQERGGIYISSIWGGLTKFPNDATFIVECPRSVEFIDRMLRHTRCTACVYTPPTWRIHRETVDMRWRGHSREALARMHDRLSRVIEFTESRPRLTAAAVRKQLAQAASALSSSAPGSPAAVVPPSGTCPEAP